MGAVLILGTSETMTGKTASKSYVRPGGNQAPHLAFDPGSGWINYFHDWGEETKRVIPSQSDTRPGGVFWMDIVGRANNLPEDTAWWDALAEQVVEICRDTATSLEFPRPFWPYMTAGGPTENRLTEHQWETVSGIVGMQHVPGLQGGEPGDVGLLVERLSAVAPPDTSPMTEIQNSLSRVGMYQGPINGLANTETAEAVSGLVDAFASGQQVSEAQARQIVDLGATLSKQETVSVGRYPDQLGSVLRDPLVDIVAALYSPEAAAQVSQILDRYSL